MSFAKIAKATPTYFRARSGALCEPASCKEAEVKTRKVIRGEKHHWWPKGLSKYWANENGLVQRIDSKGEVISSNPKEFGQISDGHNMLFKSPTPWDSTIEHYFDEPDRNMQRIVGWLGSLKSEIATEGMSTYTYLSQEGESEELDILRNCILSLAVRSPKYRNAQSAFVESFRGTLEKPETKMLIAANINQKYKTLTRSAKGRGKLAVLFSGEEEFIYGDGFYSNLNAVTEHLSGLNIVIPMTPQIAVIWSSPTAYRPNPRLISFEVDKETVALINDAVQVYSKEYLFFKTQKPDLIDDFKLGAHRIYSYETDPLKELISSIIPDESRRRFSTFKIT